MDKTLLAKVETGKVGQYYNWASDFKTAGKDAKLAYDGSLDAALRLHRSMLRGWCFDVFQDDGLAIVELWEICDGEYDAHSSGENIDPARAWLIAIIRALSD